MNTPTTTLYIESPSPITDLTRGDKVARGSVPKLMENTVAVGLLHLGMDVEARVSQLRDFLGE